MQRICNDEELKKFFGDGRTHTAAELENYFSLSTSVAYRELRRLNALPALNKPGHYTLPGVRRIDKNGFFKMADLVFCSKGTLPQALLFLVSSSPAGMTVRELEKIVLTNAKIQLLNLVKTEKLSRQKIQGEYRYFSNFEKVSALQKEACEKLSGSQDITLMIETAKCIPLALVIKILITFIKHPESSPKSIALSLIRTGNDITTEKVRAVFERYNLAKKNS